MIIAADHGQLTIGNCLDIPALWCLLYKTSKVGNKFFFSADPERNFPGFGNVVQPQYSGGDKGHFAAQFTRPGKVISRVQIYPMKMTRNFIQYILLDDDLISDTSLKVCLQHSLIYEL